MLLDAESTWFGPVWRVCFFFPFAGLSIGRCRRSLYALLFLCWIFRPCFVLECSEGLLLPPPPFHTSSSSKKPDTSSYTTASYKTPWKNHSTPTKNLTMILLQNFIYLNTFRTLFISISPSSFYRFFSVSSFLSFFNFKISF